MRSASTTLSASGWLPLPLVEKESSATRGSSPRMRAALCAEAMAMSASSAAVGWMLTPQSAKTSRLSGHCMRKKLDGVVMPGARPMVISAASMTRAVGLAAPASMACGLACGHCGARAVERLPQEACRHRIIHLLAPLRGGGRCDVPRRRAHPPCRRRWVPPGPPRGSARRRARMRSSSPSGITSFKPLPLIFALASSITLMPTDSNVNRDNFSTSSQPLHVNSQRALRREKP